MQVHNKRSLLEYRRRLRKDMTNAESILWEQLRARRLNGIKFKRQHSIGNYIPDFYCAEHRLFIELDGKIHEGKEQMEKDKFRDLHLQDMSYRVMRFSNNRIANDIKKVLLEIVSACV